MIIEILGGIALVIVAFGIANYLEGKGNCCCCEDEEDTK